MVRGGQAQALQDSHRQARLLLRGQRRHGERARRARTKSTSMSKWSSARPAICCSVSATPPRRRSSCPARSRSPTCSVPATRCRCRSTAAASTRSTRCRYTNPYFTDDGVSLGADVVQAQRRCSGAELRHSLQDLDPGHGPARGRADHRVRHDQLRPGSGADRRRNILQAVRRSTSSSSTIFGNTNTALIGTAGWARDGRDSTIYTTSGVLQRVNFEVAMPPAELRYYRTTYRVDWWIPIRRENTLQLTGQIGYADGYANLPLPFYKNFYLGGIGTVRGYETELDRTEGCVRECSRRAYPDPCGRRVLFPFPWIGEGQVGADVGFCRQRASER